MHGCLDSYSSRSRHTANRLIFIFDMTTKLDGELKREVLIKGAPYTLTIAPDKFVLALKGRRKGLEIRWADLVSGEAALATALNASLHPQTR